jgi:hypothetical protein
MKLTEQELQELAYLQGLTVSTEVPMLQEQQDRLRYLNLKEIHNNCSNPSCEGYEGSEYESKCHKCGFKLLKPT